MMARDSSDDELLQLRKLARLLDSAIRLPGGYRIGLDGIVGLIPGVGDAVTASAAAYIVIRAAQMGASTATLVRMIFNVLLELVVGSVPVIGDLFDFAWKANNRNIELLERQPERLSGRGSTRRRLTTATLMLLGAFLAVLALMVVGAVIVLVNLARTMGTG